MNRRIIKSLSMLMAPLLAALLLACPVDGKADTDGGWQFHLAPYAWLAGQKGTIATQPGLPAAGVDIDFYDDIVGNINGALLLAGEARKGELGVVFDVAYTDIEDDDVTSGPFYSSLNSRTKTWMVSAAGFYRLMQQDRAFLDGLVGLRYWSVDSSLKFGAGILPATERSNREDWVDPFIGIKGLTPIGSSDFFINGALALGGFGVGSDFMWDAMLNLGYQWTATFSTTLGYRYLDVDYDEDDFLYDVYQDGLVVGLSWRF